mmetsp:Transcript_28085/g.66796  ORF Transcript_28085/g.66796 Transcript_28085/m.66796 type:complete len:99 (-) Transcript_28085:1266-1562(-)
MSWRKNTRSWTLPPKQSCRSDRERRAESAGRETRKRENVKALILAKIQEEVGGLDSDMSGKLETEKASIRAAIDASLSSARSTATAQGAARGKVRCMS